MNIRDILFTLLVLFSAVSLAFAENISETPGVDSFSNDFENPTLFSLDPGMNLIIGEVGGSGSGTLLADGSDAGTDADYFNFVVPAGHRLDQIFVNLYDDFGRGFAAYSTGPQFQPPTDQGGGTIFYPIEDGALFSGPTSFTPDDPPVESVSR